MTWIKLDDGFADHPKVIGLSDGAYRTFIDSLCHCSRHLTDGMVVSGAVRALGGQRRFTELVTVGLMDRVEGGYQIHDYLIYNPPREQIEKQREKARERMANARGSSSNVRANNLRSSPNPVPDPLPLRSVSDPPTPRNLTPEQEELRSYLQVEVGRQVLKGRTAPDSDWCIDLIQRGLTKSDADYAIQGALNVGTEKYTRGILLRRVTDREAGNDPDAIQASAAGTGGRWSNSRGVQQGGLARGGQGAGSSDDFDDLPAHAIRAADDNGSSEANPGAGAPVSIAGRDRTSKGAR